MNVFELMGTIRLDDSDLRRGMATVQASMRQAQATAQTASNVISSAMSGSANKVNSSGNQMASVMRLVKTSMDSSANAGETNANKLSVLESAYTQAKSRVSALTAEFNRAVATEGTTSNKTIELANKLQKAENEAEDLKQNIQKLGDSFDEMGEEAEENGSKVSHSIGDATKSIGSHVEQMSAGMIAKAQIIADVIEGIVRKGVEGAKAIVMGSVDAYGNFEQLKGGAQKIFDDMDYSVIAEDAKNAYTELNMSQSEYLESINLAGATFAQTMGDQKGYETARKGMKAIADFASGTGKPLTELNQKYQLITRAASQYQSIADQFAGILPQTSADFLEQAKAAGFLKQEYTKLTDVPVAEYQEAVTNMIEKGVSDINLMGNTTAESTETVTGSMAMTKAAWENLLTAFGSGEDVKEMFGKFLESAKASAEQIVPTIKQIFDSFWEIAGSIDEFAPIIEDLINDVADLLAEELPIIGEKIPGWITGAIDFTSGLLEKISKGLENIKSDDIASAITKVGQTITKAFEKLWPNIIHIASTLVSKLASGIGKAVPSILPGAVSAIIREIVRFIKQDLPQLLSAGLDLMKGLAQGILQAIPDVIRALPELINAIVEYLVDNTDEVMDAFIELFSSLIDALPEIIEALVEAIPQIIEAIIKLIVEGIPATIEAFVKLFGAVKDAIPKVAEDIKEGTKDLVEKIKTGIEEGKHDIKEGAKNLFENIHTAFEEGWPKIKEDAMQTGKLIKKALNGELDDMEVETAEQLGATSGALAAFAVKSEPIAFNCGKAISSSITLGFSGIKAIQTETEGAVIGALASIVHNKQFDDAKETIGKFINTWSQNMKTAERVSNDGWHTTHSAMRKEQEAMVQTTSDTMDRNNKTIKQKMSEAKSTVKAAAQAMKSSMKFTFDRPKLELPHIKYQSKHVKFLGEIPDTDTLRVEWFRKAMDAPMLLNRPTIFGAMGDRYLAGGEAGPEVVSGVNPLMNMIKDASATGNSGRDAMLQVIISLLQEYLPGISAGADPETLFRAFDQRLGEAIA